MSDRRRARFFGKRVTSPLIGFWSVTLTNKDPQIPNLPLYSDAAPATCALTGTVTTAAEDDIVTGGRTIILTLTNDTWVTSGATFDGQRANIIAGLDSAQAEATGWDATVKATQGVSGVVRTSDTVVTITLDAQASYQITAPETITVTVPSTALTGAAALVASPTFDIALSAVSEVYFQMLHRIMTGMVTQTAAGMGGVLVE